MLNCKVIIRFIHLIILKIFQYIKIILEIELKETYDYK